MTDYAAPDSDPAAPNSDPADPEPDSPSHDPAVMREQYRSTALLEGDLAPTPMDQFARWFRDATSGGLREPNAMIVSTATPDGRPSSRTVLLKQFDGRGFVFYTNYASRKGGELAANPHISLLFPWHGLARQVIVTGTASRIGRDETVAYFRTRPHGSQLGAWASAQSSVIASREELLRTYEELAARYPEGEQVPAPPEWGGYRIEPETVEFWQGHENRLHDRLRYVRRTPSGAWRVERLAP
ncbi:pyridoxamine 5'-phosphate oxidase [Streptomyces sp. NPDC005279]|uniref:pyridoxamine 5'-phosphate oxidase n=1 Tax=Streptomyces sp. NPDC005279 TaxID=3364712 RepID=UPI0036B9F4ED